MLGDVEWVGASEGGDEVFAFSIRLDSRYNLGNEWEMIVGVVSAGADVRDGDGCWSSVSGYIVGTGEKTAEGDGEGAPYAEDKPLPQDGSVITTIYRPEAGSLEFALDGESMGVAFTRGIWPPVLPALAIDARAKISIVDDSFTK